MFAANVGGNCFKVVFLLSLIYVVAVKAHNILDQKICLPLRNPPSTRPPHVRQKVPGKLGPSGFPGPTGSSSRPGVVVGYASEPRELEQLNNTIQTLTGKTYIVKSNCYTHFFYNKTRFL